MIKYYIGSENNYVMTINNSQTTMTNKSEQAIDFETKELAVEMCKYLNNKINQLLNNVNGMYKVIVISLQKEVIEVENEKISEDEIIIEERSE